MKIFWIYLFLVLIILLRYLISLPKYKDGDMIRVSGRLKSPPTYYDNYQNITLLNLRINLPLTYEINYGDKIVVEGQVEKGKLKNPKMVSIEESKSKLLILRKKVLRFYSSHLPIDHAALVAGAVLGDKSALTSNFWNKLRLVGLAHVVVASGMNVTLTAAFLISLCTLILKRSIAIPFVLVGIFIYCVLAGFEAPIVRAAIMGSLLFLSQEIGRVYFAWRALVITVFIMLLINPLWLVDLGFILSVVATASILLFQKRIDSKIKFLPDFFREGMSTSLAAQIGVAPIIFVSFGQFNILSPVINALVLWTVPYIMLIGGVSSMVALISFRLAAPVLYLSYPLTAWFIWIVNLFS